MDKKKCDICGQYKPLGNFSKSYKNRCKACVAEAARNERKQFKELENACAEALKGGGAHIPVSAGAKSALTMSEKSTLLNMATAFMQGMLSNPDICNLKNMNAEAVVVLAQNAMICAKALKMVFEKESND